MKKHRLYKMTFKIADTNVEIQSPYRFHRDNLADFFTSQPPDCHVLISPDEITKYRFMSDIVSSDEDGWEGYLASEIILKKIAEILLDFDTILIHGAGIAFNGNGYLFSAPSGTGKTTHIRLWLDNLPDAFVINGDKPFIRADIGLQPVLCGSPWGGKEGMCSNQGAPLKAIVFLQRAEKNAIHQVSFKEVFLQLFQQVYRPDDPVMLHKTLNILHRIWMSDVTFWKFDCNNYAEDCFLTAYNAITKNPTTAKAEGE